MIDEKVILQVLEEQRDEVLNYDSNHWVKRGEESLFEIFAGEAVFDESEAFQVTEDLES